MSKLIFYNTLSRKKEEFEPLKDDFVRMYDCGPTVYMYAHIGNMWRYIMSDLIRRVLEYNGYTVKQVMNITDVGHLTDDDLAADSGEDKIEKAAREEKKTPEEIADFYTNAFLRDLERLNIQQPHVMPKATEHVGEMIELIRTLEEKNYTYKAGRYLVFDISKFAEYGKLSGKNLEELRAGARLEPVPGKKNPFDFALWIVDENHLQKWKSPWGTGYPGWHIECSAMSMAYLGEQLDIHTGGQDNIFPHHENEIAQSEAATGKKFVQTWLHAAFLQVEGGKMSKSEGNLYTIGDLVERGYDPLTFRYLCLTARYRHPLNFTWEALDSAQSALTRLRQKLRRSANVEESYQLTEPLVEKQDYYQQQFLQAVNDDLNMPKALSVVWEVVKEGERDSAFQSVARKLVSDFDHVLGLGLGNVEVTHVPEEVEKLVKKREQLRKAGEYNEADKVREKIRKLGFSVEDTPEGSRIQKLL
ncbi:MAG: cysteine--tRNA ligase [Patescibacteria group bacterium]|nr:cysteine--tRNA ligase [Patescibacteria group bacterium]